MAFLSFKGNNLNININSNNSIIQNYPAKRRWQVPKWVLEAIPVVTSLSILLAITIIM